MELYLIRHGETVDNVAGNYAGVRDSALTNYGVEQARRLGEYFAEQDVTFAYIFSSPLTRALKTAEAILSRQPTSNPERSDAKIEIVQVPDLIEQDFGFYEGKPFYARSDARKSGREAHHDKHKMDPGFVDVESKESMAKRADTFLDEHLLPILRMARGSSCRSIAVVSHGMLLSSLWKRLLLRLPRKSMTIAAEVTAARGSIILEHPGGWSNTGYMQLQFTATAQPTTSVVEEPPSTPHTPRKKEVTVPGLADATLDAVPPVQARPATASTSLDGWSTVIVGIDRKEHLVGLKRQRGGIGRSAFDAGQKKLDGFFKKQRTS